MIVFEIIIEILKDFGILYIGVGLLVMSIIRFMNLIVVLSEQLKASNKAYDERAVANKMISNGWLAVSGTILALISIFFK